MNALTWPVTPIIGQVFKGFQYDGKTWKKSTAGPRATWQNVQVFTASGRYEPSDNLVAVTVECIGAGGGGGWCAGWADGITIYPVAAGGGGSGGYSKRTLPASEVAQGADVIVGNGGVCPLGQAGGGVTGTDTSFGGLCVAHPGGDAQSLDASGLAGSGHGLPGHGAAIGVGDFCEPGAAGDMWAAIKINFGVQHLDSVRPGLGGQLFGGAKWPAYVGTSWLYTDANGENGLPNSGAGGGGAMINIQATTKFGGQGGSGLVVVTELCSLDTEGPPGPIQPGPSRPPGVPLNLKIKAAVSHVPAECPPAGFLEAPSPNRNGR